MEAAGRPESATLRLSHPRGPLRSSGWAAAAVLLLMGSCRAPEEGPGRGSAEPAEHSQLTEESLPAPSLAGLEAAVGEQLRVAREAARAVVADPTADAPRRAAAQGELGMHYHAYGLVEAAATCYAAASRLAPGEPRWVYYLALLDRERGRFDEAVAGLERVVAAAPDHLPARLALVEAEMGRGRLAEAQAHLAEGLRPQEPSAAARFLAGQVASARGDFAGAARHYEAALALEPWASGVRYPLGLAYRRLGEDERAREHFARRGERRVSLPDPWMREVREIASGVRTHLQRGSRAMRAGNLEAAIAEFQAAVAADGEDPTARLNLGAALAQAGRRAEAAAQLEAALALDLDAASRSKVHFNLGALLELGGRRAEAARHFEQALAWDPGNEAPQRRLEALGTAR